MQFNFERYWIGHLILIILGFPFLAITALSQVRAVPQEYIVKMKSQQKSGVSAKAITEKGQRILKALGSDIQIKKTMSQSGMLHMKSTSLDKVDFLKNHPDVEYVEPNYLLSVDDPKEQKTFGVAPEVTDSYSQSFANTQTEEAWQIAKPYDHATPKTVVAVIDTGLDLNHKVFAESNSIWNNTAEVNGISGFDDDGNGYIDDLHGWNFVTRNAIMYDDGDHGTHVAGIVLGLGQDITEYPVRESRIQIMPLKFLDGTGAGTTADAIAAIYYAVENGAQVINNSWGGTSYSQALDDAYAYAYNHNVVIVTAAGNSNYNMDQTPMYPAAFDTPSNISVIATTDSDVRASFSNYSTTKTHVAAPGVSIVSTVPGTGCANPGCFMYMSGTSMAAPYVAGLAALVIREAPQLSAYQVKTVIQSQVDVFSVLSTRTESSGRVNAFKTVQSAIANVNTVAWSPAYTVSSRSIASVVSSEDEGSGGGCGLVKTFSKNGSGPAQGLESMTWNHLAVFMIILFPLLLATGLRRQSLKTASASYQRKYDRFKVVKEIMIKTEDTLIQAATETLALGGLSFKQEALLKQGQVVKVQIGEYKEELDAEIVWCHTKQAYGVKFLNITDSLRLQISSWTDGLKPC